MHVPYTINIVSGLVNAVEFVQSPHYSQRPKDTSIDLLVIHNISLPPGEFGGSAIHDFFCNQLDFAAHPFYQGLMSLKVSSHLLIRRQGEVLQYVPFCMRAHHAGISSFLGRTDCNDFSIGIELEGTDDIPYTTTQYDVLSVITKEIMKTYPLITRKRIVGHQTIAPGRKTDPGKSFDWSHYLNLIK